jgi:GDP-4-dehydro-6-deoxy-D-mannose reductase
VRVLVTGSNGFLGRPLVARLEALGHEVDALALEPGPHDGPRFHAVDVRDGEALTALVAALDPDVVVHLAALSHVGASWTRIDEYYAVNVVGTDNVVAAAAGRRVIFSSSAEVYGLVPEQEQPIRETRAPAPRSPYALTKAVAERTARAAGAVVVRCFNLLGAGQATSFALPSFAAQLAAIETGASEPVLRVGNLAARRDFVHVEDAVEALAILIERGERGATYNLASGEARSIEEVLDTLVRLSGVAPRRLIDPERMRPIDVPLLLGDASRLRALGWTPERGVKTALAELWGAARSGAGQPA